MISFLVVFFVMLFGIYLIDIARYPLGFNYQDVLAVGLDFRGYQFDETDPKIQVMETYKQLVIGVKELPEVVSAAGMNFEPFGNGAFTTDMVHKDKKPQASVSVITDEVPQVLDINLIAGRWFSNEDNGANYIPIVINQSLSKALFGDEPPINKVLENSIIKEKDNDPRYKVIGLISDFRKDGELVAPNNYFFKRNNLQNVEKAELIQSLIIKLRPGTTAAFEEKLVNTMHNIAKGWTFDTKSLTTTHDKKWRDLITPVAMAGIVAIFLMIMVSMGLTGVLWQNVTKRTREIGLRRAHGATKTSIHSQILGELFITTTISLILGTIIVAQFPLLNLLDSLEFVTLKLFTITTVISWLILYLLTIICGLYPSFMATRVDPAQALHYE